MRIPVRGTAYAISDSISQETSVFYATEPRPNEVRYAKQPYSAYLKTLADPVVSEYVAKAVFDELIFAAATGKLPYASTVLYLMAMGWLPAENFVKEMELCE